MPLVKVEGTSYYRDTNTMALVNRDSASKDEYMFKRKLLNNQEAELNNIKTEINSLKDNLMELKTLLFQAINTKR